MGAKIGKHVEISTITNVIPDLLEIDDGCFLADGCIIGGHRIYRGVVEVRGNRIGRRSFIGNSALVPGGANVGSDSLIGVMSKPPIAYVQTPDGDTLARIAELRSSQSERGVLLSLNRKPTGRSFRQGAAERSLIQ